MKSSKIKKGIYLSEQLAFFTSQSFVSKQERYQSSFGRELHNWVVQYLGNKDENDQKVIRFFENEALLQPSKTVELFEKSFQRNRKAFNAKDRFFKVKTDQEDVDWLHKWSGYIEDEVYKAWSVSPNDFLVVDVPEDGGDPYPVLISIEDVDSFKFGKDKKLDYIKFNTAKGTHLFNRELRAMVLDGAMVDEAPHRLGYCPAIQLSTMGIGDGVVGNIYSPVLGLMKRIWFWSIANHYAETYMAYPIMWFLEDDDLTNYNSFAEFAVDHGFNDIDSLNLSSRIDLSDQYIRYQTQIKNRGNHVGPGETFILGTGEDERVQVPAGSIEPNVDGLRYLDEKMKLLEEQFLTATKGKRGEPENNKAVNEKQIEQGYQSEQEILSLIARQMERVHKFLVQCLADEKFGVEAVLVSVNYGSNFFQLTLAEAWKNYEKTKELGLTGVLQETAEDIINVQFKNDPSRRDREYIKNHLCPFYLSSNDELFEWVREGLISQKDFYIKTNFASLLNDFELGLEQPIEMIDLDLSFPERIKNVKELFTEFLTQNEEINGLERTPIQEADRSNREAGS